MRYLLILLLLAGSVSADMTVFTSFPATFGTADRSTDAWDTIMFSGGTYLNYIDTVPLTATDTLFDSAFYISNTGSFFSIEVSSGDTLNNVLILFNDSVGFGQNKTINQGRYNSNYGFSIGSPHSMSNPRMVDSLVVKPAGDRNGCLISINSDTTATGLLGITFSSAINSTFRGLNIRLPNVYSTVDVNNHYSNIIYKGAYYEAYNNRFVDCEFQYNATTSINRCSYDNAAVLLLRCMNPYDSNFTVTADTTWHSYPVDDFNYHFRFDSVTMTSTGIGLLCQGWNQSGSDGQTAGCMHVYDCTLTGDARSDTFYVATNPMTPNTCQNKANSYQIFFSNNRSSKAKRNTILSGTSYGGCRGIMVEGSGGTASIPLDIDSNTINIHEGHDIYYNEVEQHGIRVRYNNQTYHTAVYRRIRWNDITVTTDYGSATDGTDYRTSNASAIRYGGPSSGTLWPPNTFDTIAYNTFTAYAVDSNDNTSNRAVMIENVGNDSSVGFLYNRIVSDDNPMSFGTLDGATANPLSDSNFTAEMDTIVKYSPALTSFSPITLGSSSLNAVVYNFQWIDGYFLDGATDETVEFSGSVNGLREVYFKRNVDITVVDTLDNPVQNCSTYIWNTSGDTTDIADTVAFDITDVNGLSEALLTYYYRAKTSTETTTDYNDFYIKTIINSDTATATFTVAYTEAGGVDTLILSGTEGEAGVTPTKPKFGKIYLRKVK